MAQHRHGLCALAALSLLAGAACAQEALTNNRHKDWHPVISPDGRTLVFLSKRGATDLWAMDLASRKERRLTNTRVREKAMAFSPDGKQLAFLVMRNLEHRVQVLDMSTAAVHDLGPGGDAAWSPAGRRLASRDAKGLFIVDLDAGTRRRLLPASRAGVGSIRWSRKGDVIYYLHEGDLWQAAAQGPAAAKMLFSGKVEDKRANFIHFWPTAGGKRFAAVVDLGRLSIRGEDEGVALGPGQRKRLGPMTRPVWTPDGRDLIFCRGGNVLRLAAGDASPTRIAGESNACESPVVSRDGAWVYFAARNPERRGSGGRIPSKYTEIYRAALKR